MTTNFYAPPSAFRRGRVVLPDDEARHVRTVLRAQEGDEIVVVDGEGGWHRVRLTHASPEQVVGSIVDERSGVGEPAVDVTVGIGILKKRSRFETFVEKAVELGVRRIVPLQTRRTERGSVRSDRLRKLMVAAMKQCRRSRLPTLAEPQSPTSFLGDAEADVSFIGHGEERAVPLWEAAGEARAVRSALMLIGPEGGFASEEVESAEASGCVAVSLGARRLRAETAGIVALHTIVAATEVRGESFSASNVEE